MSNPCLICNYTNLYLTWILLKIWPPNTSRTRNYNIYLAWIPSTLETYLFQLIS